MIPAKLHSRNRADVAREMTSPCSLGIPTRDKSFDIKPLSNSEAAERHGEHGRQRDSGNSAENGMMPTGCPAATVTC